MTASQLRRPREQDQASDTATMGFLEHLEELRARLIRALAAIAVGMAASFFFVDRIADVVLGPVRRALPPGSELVTVGLSESLAFLVDLALIGGVIVSAPYVTYQVWRFIAPGLHRRERRLMVPLVAMTVAGTLAGAAFSHYVLFPASVAFLLQLTGRLEGVVAMPTLANTFALYKSMLLAMVAVFQMPAVIFLLARLGMVTAGFLWRNVKYAVLVIFVAAAVLTSSPDPWNQLFTAAPMLAMYLVSIGVAWMARPRSRTDGPDDSSPAMDLVVSAAVFERARRERQKRLARIAGI
jgi:sec-independent protein translocase protein TatC